LVTEVHNRAFVEKRGEMQRLRRFHDVTEEEQRWLRSCVNQFREPISYTVPDHVPKDEPFVAKLETLAKEHASFLTNPMDANKVQMVISKVSQVAENQIHDEKTAQYNAEVVHEQVQYILFIIL
jgi:hypothetical protein